jgi:hypothetical protein
MNTRFFGLILLPLLSWAAPYQVLPVEGGDENLRSAVGALVRNAVVEAGETPVDSATSLSLRTSLIQLGQSYTVVVEARENGQVKNSAQMKAANAEELDVIVKRAVDGAIKGSSAPEQASIGNISKKEEQEVVARKETRSYQSFGLGPVWLFNMKSDKMGYMIRQNRIWEVNPHAAINILADGSINFDKFATHDNILLGGRFYLTATSFSPYIGAGFGFGIAAEKGEFAYGFDAGAQAGLVIFRTSGTQLEIFCDYDVIFNDGGKHKLAAGVAINYQSPLSVESPLIADA